ncbi:hypothetical protein OOK52_40055 [Streptomyces sp. NBC_01565]|nr:hypothetical protein [Streptomyces sp. NBC_01565]
MIDAEVVGDPLADLEDALKRLRAVNRDVTREALAAGREAGDPERYRRISQALLSTATSPCGTGSARADGSTRSHQGPRAEARGPCA